MATRSRSSAKPNVFYTQSGGVTAVINASAAGVIETARAHKDRLGKVYAGANGILGALQEELNSARLAAETASGEAAKAARAAAERERALRGAPIARHRAAAPPAANGGVRFAGVR